VRNLHLLTPTLYVMFHSVSFRLFINNLANNFLVDKRTFHANKGLMSVLSCARARARVANHIP